MGKNNIKHRKQDLHTYLTSILKDLL